MKQPLFLLLLSLFSASCQVRPAPGPTTSEPCIPMTGERDYDAAITAYPPAAVSTGESFSLSFAGGYYDVFPACEKIGNSLVYHYPTIEELGTRWRMVEVILNHELIHAQECSYHCEIAFSIPEEIEPGSYPLVVRPASYLYHPRDMEFVVEIRR